MLYMHANVLNKLHEAAIVLHCYFSMYIYVCNIYTYVYIFHMKHLTKTN